MWARVRAELGAVPAVAIVPKDNILIGYKAICAYLGVRERRILERWIDEFGLPVIHRPDGQAMSSITSIDQWILLAARVTYENKFKDGQTTTQKRANAVSKWRQNRTSPSISTLYRYGAPPEVDEFRQGAIHRSLGGVDRAGSQLGSSEDARGERAGEVHDSSGEHRQDGGLQRQDGDEHRGHTQLPLPK